MEWEISSTVSIIYYFYNKKSKAHKISKQGTVYEAQNATER